MHKEADGTPCRQKVALKALLCTKMHACIDGAWDGHSFEQSISMPTFDFSVTQTTRRALTSLTHCVSEGLEGLGATEHGCLHVQEADVTNGTGVRSGVSWHQTVTIFVQLPTVECFSSLSSMVTFVSKLLFCQFFRNLPTATLVRCSHVERRIHD